MPCGLFHAPVSDKLPPVMPTTPPKPVFGARDAALSAILDAWSGKGFAADSIRQRRQAGLLGARDADLAIHLALAALRHGQTIDHVLSAVARYQRRRVSPWIRAVLHLAASQVVYSDRVPPHAAVHQAVELARGVAGSSAAGMCNAVLRRLCGAIREERGPWKADDSQRVRIEWDRAALFNTAVLPDPLADSEEHLLAASGVPRVVWRAAQASAGTEAARNMAWASQATPCIHLHPNPLKVSADSFRSAVLELEPLVEWSDGIAVLPLDARVLDSPLLREGLAFVQDRTAHAAALYVGARAGERILDYCAAPGGKTIAMAFASGGLAQVVACDASRSRLKRVSDNIERLGIGNVQAVLLPSGGSSPFDSEESFDAVLVDVPCTNTGVLARRPEARFRLGERHLHQLIELQASLLSSAAAHVRPGGRLVYSTCSVLPRENAEQVRRFLADRHTWNLEDERMTLPAWGPRATDWQDGGFVARLRHR